MSTQGTINEASETSTKKTIGLVEEEAQEALRAFDPTEGERAVRLIADRIRGIPLGEVRRMHISTPGLVSIGLCYASNYSEDRPLFEAAFKPAVFDVAEYDDLYERAMGYWHLSISVRQDEEGPLRLLLAEAKPLRAKLVRAATYLWGHDLKLKDLVGNIRSGHAYLSQADDMGALSKLFMDNWDRAEGRCDVTREDVVKAQSLGARFLETVAQSRTEELSEMKELCLKAGEHLRRGMEKVQAAAAFVFAGEEQKLTRYPSFYIMKKKRKNGEPEEAAADEGESLDVDMSEDEALLPPQTN